MQLLKALRACALFPAILSISSARAIDHSTTAGEPYALSGNRLVFTNWLYVRLGSLDWRDKAGKSVFASPKSALGPLDATFVAEDVPHGIQLVVQPAEHVGPIIPRAKAWEKMGVSPETLILQDGKYRLWASCQADAGKHAAGDETGGGGCYYESADGKTWTRPSLGIVSFQNSKENNLFGQGVGEIFLDPTAKPEQRFKAVHDAHVSEAQFVEFKAHHPYSRFAAEVKPKTVFGLLGSVSADGFHWTELPQPLSIEVSDTQVVTTYDARLKKYVMYTRSYDVASRAPGTEEPARRGHDAIQRRSIGRSESEDFTYFPLSRTIIEPELDRPPTDTLYTNAATSVPGAPEDYLMFPAVYHQDSDTTSIDVYSSDDSYSWQRLSRSPVLSPGNFGAWDGGCVFAHPNLVELPDGSWVLPYTGYAFPHKYPRGAWSYDAGLARWPKGRLVGVQAADEGSFATVAFVPPAKKVLINAVTNRAGSVLVEACDVNGKPIPGHSFADATPVVGDVFQGALKWKGGEDLGDVSKGIILRFKMERATLFGVEFR